MRQASYVLGKWFCSTVDLNGPLQGCRPICRNVRDKQKIAMQIVLAWIWEEAWCGSLHLKLDIILLFCMNAAVFTCRSWNGLAYLEQLHSNAAPTYFQNPSMALCLNTIAAVCRHALHREVIFSRGGRLEFALVDPALCKSDSKFKFK